MRRISKGEHAPRTKLLKDVYTYEVPNFVFRNNGDLTFTDKTGRNGASTRRAFPTAPPTPISITTAGSISS